MKKTTLLTTLSLLAMTSFSLPAFAETEIVSTPKSTATSTNAVSTPKPTVMSSAATNADAILTPKPVAPVTPAPTPSALSAEPAVVKAASTEKSAVTKPVPVPLAGEIEGTVETLDATWFAVNQGKGKNINIQINKSSSISKGSKPATWADLQQGARVKVEYTPNADQLIAKSVAIL